ncbi:MAG: DUF4422 domain-containing protein [Muribaculaceae bacterium]|nr:DUF4422 domain-containing protein [Muribaculaceae bacterium]
MKYHNITSIISALQTENFCIYGAGIVATSVYTAIKTLYQKCPLFFLVSDAEDGKCDENPREIDGIAVKRLSEWEKEREQDQTQTRVCRRQVSDKYLIVTPEIHQPSIIASLRFCGILDEQMIPFTGQLENAVMEAYYGALPGCRTVSGLLSGVAIQASEASALSNVQVFQAKSHVDKPLKNPVSPPAYVYPIQVGADLTDEVIVRLRDNEGENISGKNRNYCELTASYYAWKNSHAAYKGLCHYRRLFDITEAQMQELLGKGSEWDVILPYPSIHYPNLSAQHIRYIKDSDWRAMLKALEETAPAYLEAYEAFVRSGEQFFYNYNMVIAKAEIFDDYCRFLFSVLERAQELTMPKGADRADRFAGYMGENLTTIYFLKNRDKFKIIYAGKKWFT